MGDAQVQAQRQFLTPVSKRGVQVEPAPAPAPSLEDRIRSAHAALSGGDPTRSIQLKDMRAQLPDVPKDVLDKELVRLHEEPDNGIEMGMSSNGPARTAENLLGGIAYKGDIVHEMTASPRLIESGSVKERIADAFDQLAALKGPGMQRLNDLRSMVPDVSRTNFDKALLDGFKDRSVNLMGFDNPRDIQAVGDAKLQYGRTADQVAHVVNIEDRAKFTGRPQTIPPSDDPITDLRQMYQTETDPDRKMYAAVALATGDPEKASAVLQALQMAKGFFSNEAGSLNLGALGQAFNKLTGKVKKGIADDLSRPQTEATKPEDMIENQAARTPGQMEGRAKAFNAFSDLAVNNQMAKVVKAGDTANRAIRKQLQPALGGSQIAQFAGRHLRSATGWMARLETNAAIERKLNMNDATYALSYIKAPEALKIQASRMLELLNDGSGIDPRKKWSDHSEAMRTGPNKEALMAKHRAGAAEWSRMQQNGSAGIVNNITALNMAKGYQAVGANLQKWREALAPKGMKSVLPNPHEAAQFDDVRTSDPVDNLRKSRDAAWGLFNEIKDFVASQDDLGQQAKPAEAKTILAGLEGVRSALRANEARLGQIAEGTYSPLSHGRGEHFVAGKIAVDDAGRPLPKAVAAIRNAMDESGFGDVGMFHDAENNSIMTRLQTASQMEDLERIFNKMEKQGHMLPGETRGGYAKDPAKMARIVPAHIQALITELSNAIDKSDTIDPAQRDEIKATMRMHLMDTLPDHNMASSDQERTHAQGFDTRMGDVAIQRALDGSRSSTAIAMSGKTAEARQAMSNEVKAAQNDPSLRPQERLIGADAQREYAIREGADPWYAKNSIFDVLRSGTQALEVGTRLPYALTMASQIFTLAHGELAKIYGHVRAAKALAASATDAFRALKVMFTGVGRMTLDLRRSELEAAGNISQKSIDTLMHLANSGKLTTFNQSMAALGAGESGGAIPSVRKTLEIANLWGSYMEMYPRLITGLAAAKLHDERFGNKSIRKGRASRITLGRW